MGHLGKAVRKITIVLFLLVYTALPRLAADNVDKLKRRIKMISAHAAGWCSEEKTMSFVDLVLQIKPKVCVEIGVFGGASLLPVACALNFLGEGIAIGIDPWNNSECIKYLDVEDEKEHVDWWSKVKIVDMYHGVLDRLLLYGLEDCCCLIKKTSEQAVAEIEHIDVLHIDGHRSEEITLRDAELYLPKVISGGYIWVGDTLSFNKQRAIDFILEQCDVVKIIDNGNCVLFKKR